MSEAVATRLVVEDDEGHRSTYPVPRETPGELILGRDKSSQVVLDERNISRKHARLSWATDGALWVEDLGSYNGTFLNGQRLAKRRAVSQGDVLRVGDFQLELLAERPSRSENTQRIVVYNTDDHTEPDGQGVARPLPDESTVPAQLTPVLGVQVPNVFVPPHKVAAGRQADVAHFLCITSSLAGQAFPLDQPELVVGRDKSCGIYLPHSSVHLRHALVRVKDGRVRLADLASNQSAGLAVNGDFFRDVELKNGDLLELGHVRLRYVAAGRQPLLDAAELQALPVHKGRGVRAAAVAALIVAVCGTGGYRFVVTKQSHSGGPQTALVGAAPAPGQEARSLVAQAAQAADKHQFRRATALASAALALDPSVPGAAILVEHSSAEARGEMALAEAESARSRGALEEAQKALDDVPGDTGAAQKARSLHLQIVKESIESKVAQAGQALVQGHTEEAKTLAAALTETAPDNPQVVALVAQLKDGRERAQSVPIKSKGGPEVRALHAEGARALGIGQYFRAIDSLLKCLQTDHGYAPCYRTLGLAYAKSGNAAKAQHCLKQYLKMEPAPRDAAALHKLLHELEGQVHSMTASDE